MCVYAITGHGRHVQSHHHRMICVWNLVICLDVITFVLKKYLFFEWIRLHLLTWSGRLWDWGRYPKFQEFTVQVYLFEPFAQSIKKSLCSLFKPLCLMGPFPSARHGGIQTNHIPHILTNYHPLPNYHIPILKAKAKHLHPLKWCPWAESRMCVLFPVQLVVNLC